MCEDWSCPECSAGWDWVIDLERRLSDTGYAHLDNHEKCGKCGAEWTRGEPKGRSDVDRSCAICGTQLLAHKFRPDGDDVRHFHWKCPECHYVPSDDDEPLIRLNNGELATGYPSITGEIVDERGTWLDG